MSPLTGEQTGRPPLPEEAPGVRRRAGTHDSRIYTGDEKHRVLALVDAGYSFAAAGRELGVSRSTVGGWVRSTRG